MKKLSIIIINYNTSGFVKNCLESLRQSLGDLENSIKTWEIIVVDNNSAEDLNPLRQYLNQYPAETFFYQNKSNEGFAKANNLAVARSKGQYILFLNPDTLVTSQALNYVLHYLERHKEVGIVSCRVNLANGTLDDACHRGYPTPWNSFCYFSGLANLFPQSAFFNGYHLGFKKMEKVHEIDACSGAFMMARKECGEQINWFDEDYFWYGEDLDFCYKAKQNNWRIVFLPQVSITHFKGVSSGIKFHSQKISSADRETKKKAQQARFEAMRIFYRKHYQNKYFLPIRWVVFFGIKLKEKYENRH